MQAKPFGSINIFFLKSCFVSENMLLIGLEGFLEDLRNLGICLKWFEAILQKI
jgi:hypothetical protein